MRGVLLTGVGISSVLSIFFYFTNRVLHPMLPRLPTIGLQLFFLRFIVKRVTRCIVFPGCTHFWKFSIQQQLATPALKSLRRLLSQPDLTEGLVARLDQISRVLRQQRLDNSLTKNQQLLLENLEKRESEITTLNTVRTLVDKNIGAYESKWAIFNHRTPLIYGLDFMRAQLELDAQAKMFRVGQVDVILIPRPTQDVLSPDAKVVLFCNPNAGFLETTALNSEFVELYASLGYSFCSFNYRGYNGSSGWPSVENIAADSLLVFDFLRNHLGFKHVGVHGRSIGGICAVNLGATKTGQVDFVVADRTFTRLSDVAKSMIGNWAQTAVIALGENSQDLSQQWLNITAPKILLVADDDEIIRPTASLATGVAKRVAAVQIAAADIAKACACANALACSMNTHLQQGQGQSVGRSYTLPTDAIEVNEQVADAIVEFVGVPDGERFTNDEIEGALARLQVWDTPAKATQRINALTAALDASHRPESASFVRLAVEPLRRVFAKGEVTDNPGGARRGLLLTLSGGHNDNLSTREKAMIAETLKCYSIAVNSI